MVLSGLLKKLEVKPTGDEYEAIKTSRWGNRDVYPIPHDKRTYGVYAFVSYWGKASHPPLMNTVDEIKQELVVSVCHHGPLEVL
jgi:hypothetical protein